MQVRPGTGVGSGSTAGWSYVQNSGAFEIFSLLHLCPEVALFPGLAWPFQAPLGSSQALQGTYFPAASGPCSMREEVVVWEQVFSLPRSH